MTKPTTPKNQNAVKSSESNFNTPRAKNVNTRSWDPDRQIVHRSVIEGSKNQAARLFNVLALGNRIHRRNCDKFGFQWNGPVHSWVSSLEKMYDIPVEGQWLTIETEEGPTRVVEYWFSKETIKCLNDLFLRQQLAEETRRGREEGYLKRVLKRTRTANEILAEFPKVGSFHPEQLAEFETLAREILDVVAGVKNHDNPQ